MKIAFKFFNTDYEELCDEDGVYLPHHKREGDAGVDVRAMEDYVLEPGEVKQFKLGFGIELPKGCFARIEGRSGNAIKYGIDTIGNIIDENYRGEISAILVNNGKIPFHIEKFDRIAQLIIQQYIPNHFVIVNKLVDTNRGDAGYGSTGNK